MGKRILITGGAGFLGSHLADELLKHGYEVRVLDSLDPQVHGTGARWPGYLHAETERIRGDIRDSAVVGRAMRGVEGVFHFAAAVGVGQSMYQIERYTDINNRGTAVLLDGLRDQPVERLVVASSMSVYGEGLYRNRGGGLVTAARRRVAQLRAKRWELQDDSGEPLGPVATPEHKLPQPSSVYALSKFHQERIGLIVGQAYAIPTVALRFFNAYGRRQALSNPYTGVLAIFASRYLNGRPPKIFEDGRQRRDFVSVHDIAYACRLALEKPAAAGHVFNIGSGRSYSILEVATRMAEVLGREDIEPEVTGVYRSGDIRHCFADIGQARRLLGYEPRVSLNAGLEDFADWLAGQHADDHTESADAELAERGLRL